MKRNPNLPKLIGITGKAGVGKDTLADVFCSWSYKCRREAFADPLKEACATLFGIPGEDFYVQELKEIENPVWKITPRKIAQLFGTEIVRHNFHRILNDLGEDFWWRRLEAKLQNQLPGEDCVYNPVEDIVIITDVRFQNEYDWIIRSGGVVIQVRRPNVQVVGVSNHQSESGIYNFHTQENCYVINNDSTLEDFEAKAKDIFIQINQRFSS